MKRRRKRAIGPRHLRFLQHEIQDANGGRCGEQVPKPKRLEAYHVGIVVLVQNQLSNMPPRGCELIPVAPASFVLETETGRKRPDQPMRMTHIIFPAGEEHASGKRELAALRVSGEVVNHVSLGEQFGVRQPFSPPCECTSAKPRQCRVRVGMVQVALPAVLVEPPQMALRRWERLF